MLLHPSAASPPAPSTANRAVAPRGRAASAAPAAAAGAASWPWTGPVPGILYSAGSQCRQRWRKRLRIRRIVRCWRIGGMLGASLKRLTKLKRGGSLKEF